MQDLLSELQSDVPSRPEETPIQIDFNQEEEEDGAEFMHDFFDFVNKIKTAMATINRNIANIEESYSQALVAINAEQGAKSSDELESMITSTNATANEVRKMLKEMDSQNKKISKGTAEYRIRVNMHGTLTKKFMELMSKYQEVQTKYKNKFRERVERQYKIVKPTATQEEIDEALESGNTQIFANQILDQRHAAAKDALAYIENRHRDILKLEQSIKELHQLFVDMAILVEAQGELIDQIEHNVNQSVAYVKKARDNIRVANKYQRKSRKKMCIIIVLLIIIVGALVLTGSIVGGVLGSS